MRFKTTIITLALLTSPLLIEAQMDSSDSMDLIQPSSDNSPQNDIISRATGDITGSQGHISSAKKVVKQSKKSISDNNLKKSSSDASTDDSISSNFADDSTLNDSSSKDDDSDSSSFATPNTNNNKKKSSTRNSPAENQTFDTASQIPMVCRDICRPSASVLNKCIQKAPSSLAETGNDEKYNQWLSEHCLCEPSLLDTISPCMLCHSKNFNAPFNSSKDLQMACSHGPLYTWQTWATTFIAPIQMNINGTGIPTANGTDNANAQSTGFMKSVMGTREVVMGVAVALAAGLLF